MESQQIYFAAIPCSDADAADYSKARQRNCTIRYNVLHNYLTIRKVYCAHEYTEANIRFALACEPGNAQLKQRKEDAHALRAAGQPTLPSTIKLEKATNPFLRCTEPEIIRTLQGRGLTDSAELAVFTALREWKNHF